MQFAYAFDLITLNHIWRRFNFKTFSPLFIFERKIIEIQNIGWIAGWKSHIQGTEQFFRWNGVVLIFVY